MKKKILFGVVVVLSICGSITAGQGDIQVLTEECDCCQNATSTRCYVIYENSVLSCGTGENICDIEPPLD